MPPVCRRIVLLLAVACLGVGWVGGSVSTALAQSAGDQQYQDPFGGSGAGSGGSSGKSGSGSSGSSGSSTIQPLSPSPQTAGGSSGSSGSASSSASAPAQPAASPAATGSLPNTGLDTRLLVLAGAVLLLVGVGLRLRNAPERF